VEIVRFHAKNKVAEKVRPWLTELYIGEPGLVLQDATNIARVVCELC
jgi:hypothetical protein